MLKKVLLLLVEMKTKPLVIEVNCETDFVAKNEDFVQILLKNLSELNNKKKFKSRTS